MKAIERILCPTDLSVEADEALRYALALTRAYGAELILLYCKQAGSVSEWVNGARAQRLFEQSLFTHLDGRELKALRWQGVITECDDIGRAITKEAAERNADLIVMRSRRRPHAAALLGSTAETVSRFAPCPVIVTHPREREWVGKSTGDIDLHRVLIATDFSSDAELALNYGRSLAQQFQTELHLLYVITDNGQPESDLAWSSPLMESAFTSVTWKLRQSVPKEVWGNIKTAVRCGEPAEQILAYARENKIGLIAIGAHGPNAGFFGSLFGSTVDRVLRRAPCPVFVARQPKSAREFRNVAGAA